MVLIIHINKLRRNWDDHSDTKERESRKSNFMRGKRQEGDKRDSIMGWFTLLTRRVKASKNPERSHRSKTMYNTIHCVA